MTMIDSLLRSLRASSRRVAFAILAGFWRGRTRHEVEQRISERPAHEQAVIVAAVLGALFLTSLLFAHGGVIGMLIFFLLVIFLIQ